MHAIVHIHVLTFTLARFMHDIMGANIDSRIISSVMDSKGVLPHEIPEEGNRIERDDPDSIKGSKRYFIVCGLAEFNTHWGCRREWCSAQAWAIIDLKLQRIAHYYQQSCRHCEGEANPKFEEGEIQRMAEWAVDEYLHKSGRVRKTAIRRDPVPDEYQSQQPHDSERCEMCKLRGRGRPCTLESAPAISLSNFPTTRVDWGSESGEELRVHGYTQPGYNRDNDRCVIS